jgi:hypothetical protein
VKLATALRLGRVSNLPTVWTNVAAGLALSGSPFSASLALSLCAAISLAYVGGMYLNDAFDREYDRAERKERPIPAGEVSAASVFTLGFGMLALGVAIVAALSWLGSPGRPAALAAALALAATIVVYDAFHKRNPLSPLLMALTRALVYVTAALATGAAFDARLGWGSVVLFCYVVGLTYAAKQENLREPTGMWPLALMQLPLLAYALAFATPLCLALFVLLAAWLAYCLVFLLSPRRRNIKRAVGYMIAGISLLDAMIVGSQGLLVLALFCLLGFGATLLAQRSIPGT